MKLLMGLPTLAGAGSLRQYFPGFVYYKHILSLNVFDGLAYDIVHSFLVPRAPFTRPKI